MQKGILMNSKSIDSMIEWIEARAAGSTILYRFRNIVAMPIYLVDVVVREGRYPTLSNAKESMMRSLECRLYALRQLSQEQTSDQDVPRM